MDDQHKEIHATALKRFESIQTAERDQRRLAVEDLRFAQTEDGQWDDDAAEKRAGRPRYTINRVAGAIDQLTGDQRQNITNIKIRPTEGGATEDNARILEGLIRNIEFCSDAQGAYDEAFDEVVNGGFGGWRVLTEYADDASFNQSIRIAPIKGATTSLWFGPSERYDRRDAPYAFLVTDMTKEDHKEKHPNSTGVNFAQEQFSKSCARNWYDNDIVKVAEYWVKTPIIKEIALLSDGRVIDLKEEKQVIDELLASGLKIEKTRKVKSHKVQMYLIDGSGVLDGPHDWAGSYIPLIPMYGRQTHIEGVDYTRGLVRFAKDANRIYNYTTSAAVETTALTPKDPIWITPTQATGHEKGLQNFNTRNSPFMLYNADPLAPGAPQRGGSPAVQGAFVQQIQQASMDLYHVTNMQPPSLGANPELKSGKAIQAQERLGDRGSYIYFSNKEKSIRYTAEILIDLIPKIMDTEQQRRILRLDGETEEVTLNQTVIDSQTGEEVIVNDLAIGKYAVVPETGPAFSTQRQESAQQIIDLIATSPTFEALAMDLVSKDLPILESKELTKRVRKQMIQNGVIEPTEDEIKELGLDQEQQPDPQQTAITDNINMQTEKLMSEIENKDADTTGKLIKAQQSTIESYKTLMDAYKTQLDAGIPFTADDHDIRVKQQDLIEEAQQEIIEGPNNEQAQSMGQELTPQQAQEVPQRLTVEQPTINTDL